jgi:alkyl sulfatase BDS1-like metallo-beta-lactamase superfamily hydrolase
LKPARDAALAREVAALAGGADKLAARARALVLAADDPSDDGLRFAGHLAELAALAAPGDPAVHAVRAEVFERRVAAATSTMAKGVFAWAAGESRRQS